MEFKDDQENGQQLSLGHSGTEGLTCLNMKSKCMFLPCQDKH